MEAFSAVLAICAGNSPVSSELPAQRPVTGSFDVFYPRLNTRLSKQSGAGDLRRHRAHYDITMMCFAKMQFFTMDYSRVYIMFSISSPPCHPINKQYSTVGHVMTQ